MPSAVWSQLAHSMSFVTAIWFQNPRIQKCYNTGEIYPASVKLHLQWFHEEISGLAGVQIIGIAFLARYPCQPEDAEQTEGDEETTSIITESSSESRAQRRRYGIYISITQFYSTKSSWWFLLNSQLHHSKATLLFTRSTKSNIHFFTYSSMHRPHLLSTPCATAWHKFPTTGHL